MYNYNKPGVVPNVIKCNFESHKPLTEVNIRNLILLEQKT